MPVLERAAEIFELVLLAGWRAAPCRWSSAVVASSSGASGLTALERRRAARRRPRRGGRPRVARLRGEDGVGELGRQHRRHGLAREAELCGLVELGVGGDGGRARSCAIWPASSLARASSACMRCSSAQAAATLSRMAASSGRWLWHDVLDHDQRIAAVRQRNEVALLALHGGVDLGHEGGVGGERRRRAVGDMALRVEALEAHEFDALDLLRRCPAGACRRRAGRRSRWPS